MQSRFSDNLWFNDYFANTIFSIFYIKSFDLVTLCNLVTVFAETKSVTKSRLHCICISKADSIIIELSYQYSSSVQHVTQFLPFIKIIYLISILFSISFWNLSAPNNQLIIFSYQLNLNFAFYTTETLFTIYITHKSLQHFDSN